MHPVPKRGGEGDRVVRRGEKAWISRIEGGKGKKRAGKTLGPVEKKKAKG